MTTMSSQVMLARLDRLDKVMHFFAQCPASKRGKPMDPGAAIHAEKANPGSVCMKISRARDGRGERHVFYKVTSRAEKAAQKTKQKESESAAQDKPKETAEPSRPQPRAASPQPPKPAKPLSPVEMLKRKAAAIAPMTQAPAAKKPVPGTPTFHSGVEGLSEKQQRWGKIFHHQLERDLRSYIGSLGESATEMKPYTSEAWINLMGLAKAGSIFGLKGLDGGRLFWSLLSPESAKALAAKTGMNLAAGEHGPVFTRIMRGKFKDDPSFQEASSQGRAWPVANVQPQAVATLPPAPPPKSGKLSRLAARVKDSKLVGQAKEKIGKAKEKALAAKQKADEWQKAHPILSTAAKWGVKVGLGSLGLMQSQSPIVRLDYVDEMLKFYAQCPASKRGRPMNVGTICV